MSSPWSARRMPWNRLLKVSVTLICSVWRFAATTVTSWQVRSLADWVQPGTMLRCTPDCLIVKNGTCHSPNGLFSIVIEEGVSSVLRRLLFLLRSRFSWRSRALHFSSSQRPLRDRSLRLSLRDRSPDRIDLFYCLFEPAPLTGLGIVSSTRLRLKGSGI